MLICDIYFFHIFVYHKFPRTEHVEVKQINKGENHCPVEYRAEPRRYFVIKFPYAIEVMVEHDILFPFNLDCARNILPEPLKERWLDCTCFHETGGCLRLPIDQQKEYHEHHDYHKYGNHSRILRIFIHIHSGLLRLSKDIHS